MIAVGKYGGFCNMITFLINIFCSGTLRTIAYPAKRLKFITIRFYNVTVIDMNDRVSRAPFLYVG